MTTVMYLNGYVFADTRTSYLEQSSDGKEKIQDAVNDRMKIHKEYGYTVVNSGSLFRTKEFLYRFYKMPYCISYLCSSPGKNIYSKTFIIDNKRVLVYETKSLSIFNPLRLLGFKYRWVNCEIYKRKDIMYQPLALGSGFDTLVEFFNHLPPLPDLQNYDGLKKDDIILEIAKMAFQKAHDCDPYTGHYMTYTHVDSDKPVEVLELDRFFC